MNIALTTLTLAAPLHGKPRRKQRSHSRAYRKAYVAKMIARQRVHGPQGVKAKGTLLQTIGMMSQSDVARVLGITREAVRQTENRALAKLRMALWPYYQSLIQ